jgi:hypothetical protein
MHKPAQTLVSPHACPLIAPLFLRPFGGAETSPSMVRCRLRSRVAALRNAARSAFLRGLQGARRPGLRGVFLDMPIGNR